MKSSIKTFIFLAIFCLIVTITQQPRASSSISSLISSPIKSIITTTITFIPTGVSPTTLITITTITTIPSISSSIDDTSSETNGSTPKFLKPLLIGSGIGVVVLISIICIIIFIFHKKRNNVLKIAGSRDSR
ncbi:hypothetical protein Glove_421g97 [Diversispora epigaea]|uniref:Mid2 domain-containing protein n=1 Tax=Diversispora epigaea TaxID=1348612 RepID=A0A397GZM9_9GLOM|nr:hypothetical protein Glove_421g97 [Diversispora epigaea]